MKNVILVVVVACFVGNVSGANLGNEVSSNRTQRDTRKICPVGQALTMKLQCDPGSRNAWARIMPNSLGVEPCAVSEERCEVIVGPEGTDDATNAYADRVYVIFGVDRLDGKLPN